MFVYARSLLALFAMTALLTLSACSNDTGNTGNTGNTLPTDTGTIADSAATADTGAVAADTGATTDTGAAATDVTSKDAATPDTTATPDATAAPDSTATPDATATPDSTSSPDTAVTADAAVTTDGGPNTADAGVADGSGTPTTCVTQGCKYVPGSACQCDAACVNAGDCCADYITQCKKGTCKVDADCDDDNACTSESCEGGKECKFTLVADTTACDDGNPCTEKAACAKGACEGTAKPDATACDDGKFCTEKGACAKGVCKGTNKPKDTPCDDGKICTQGDKCSSYGSCFGSSKDCDDDKPCTTDSCDPKTGTCQHEVKKDGSYCSDGNSCTEKDACKAGVCEATPKKDDSYCSDSNSCTKDKCVAGKCVSEPDATKDGKYCTDGNSCTKDACLSGTCVSKADATKDGATCSDDDPCTANAKCATGKCSGPQDACDDDNPCTMDSCTKKSQYSKECKNEPMKDGAACDDGDPCTEGDACAALKCIAKPSTKCTDALNDSFPCGSNGTWTLDPVADDAKGVVGWAVDQTPAGPVAPSPKCSLNFNNGKDFDAKDGAGKSVKVSGTAVSAAIDLTTAAGAKLTYQSYIDAETISYGDSLYVEVSSDDFKTTAKSWKLAKPSSAIKKWVLGTHDLTPWIGKKIKLRLRFDSIDAINNTGAGWFVDDLKVQVLPK